MLNHLNPRTREIVAKLSEGSSAELGGEPIGDFNESEQTLLRVVATQVSELGELRGGGLVERAMEFLDAAEEEKTADTQDDADSDTHEEKERPQCRYKLGVIRACSFRGLAPAGRTWEFDFEGESHLMYGPNGCGKSSLLGAISYCLTGRIFRDDQAPDLPMSERAYPVEGGTHATERPDALALMDESGRNTPPDAAFWAEVQLLSDDQGNGQMELLVRRHSAEGLTVSVNGEAPCSVQSLRAVGVDELDAELNLIMPARLPHLHFGKEEVLIRTLSQVIGLDDLETIADLAGRLVTALRSEVTRTLKPAVVHEEESVAEVRKLLKETKNDLIRGLDSYADAAGDEGTLVDVEKFGKAISAAIEANNKQLASDLGIDMPGKDSDAFSQFQKNLVDLPGQVRLVLDELEKPLPQLFDHSLGFNTPTGDECSELEKKLDEFVMHAQQHVNERLDWAQKERDDAKARLKLIAAKHFPQGADKCPVCDQDLDEAPSVKEELESLRPLSVRPNLDIDVDNLELRLLDELGSIVSTEKRAKGATGLADRVLSDWRSLREKASKGLLGQILANCDSAMEAISQKLVIEELPPYTPLADAYRDGLGDTFHRVDKAINEVKAYLILCRSVIHNESVLSEALCEILTAKQCEGRDDSLRVILERGKEASEAIGVLAQALQWAKRLYQGVKKKDELLEKVLKHETWASAGERVKSLGEGVRNEVMRMVQELDGKMKGYYNQLYDNEILVLDMLTTGHAGNANVKGEINAYLRAGQERVPVGPFSNAGRFRALVLSFVFALLDESKGTLAITVLDDPAVSLDDEHKARLVNRIIGPVLASKQVLLATHYEGFHRLAERAFVGQRNLCLVPRREVTEDVAFEAGDILERVERSLQENRGSWRDQAGSLRRWIERTLRTLSGYCPEAFWKHNDLVGTVNAYQRIVDARVATTERDRICEIVSRESIEDVRRLAHDEDAEYSEFEAQLRSLKECKKHANKEIERLRRIYEEELAAVKLACAPTVQLLSLTNQIPPWSLTVVREAAAAHNGQGIEWNESVLYSFDAHQVAIATKDIGSPVVLTGQRMLLDSQERAPSDEDLVVIKTADGGRYFRRFWRRPDGTLLLEALNPTEPTPPIQLSEGVHDIRRVVGVFFDRVTLTGDSSTHEWVPGGIQEGLLDGVVGLRVRGTSMEPIVRDGQIVLVRKGVESQIGRGDLGCVDIADAGTVIKRCYPSEDEWVLCSVNPTDLEDPIRVRSEDILHAYPLIGVMFELEPCT